MDQRNTLPKKLFYLFFVTSMLLVETLFGFGSMNPSNDNAYAAEDERVVLVIPSTKHSLVRLGINGSIDNYESVIKDEPEEIKTESVPKVVTVENEEEASIFDEVVDFNAVEPEVDPEVVLEPVYIDNPDLVIQLTNEELDLLERLVECEARGEDMVGKILVADVVINRVVSGRFPNSVSGVINAHNQFATVSSGQIDSITAVDSTKEAVSRALSGEDYSAGALYFMNPRYCKGGWFDSALTKVVVYGNHNFYK